MQSAVDNRPMMCCKVKSLLSGHYNSPSSLRPHEESPCLGVNSNGRKISRITTANILDNYKDHVVDMKLGVVLWPLGGVLGSSPLTQFTE